MAPPLRVLLLNNYLPPRGGAETHVVGVRDLLAAAGHAVELHAPGEASGWPALRDRFHNPEVAALVRERITAFRPDVVHVHNFLRRLSTAPLAAARAAGVPVAVSVHDFQLFCPRTWAVRADGTPCEGPSLPLCLLGNCRGGLEGFGGRVAYAVNALRRPRAARAVARGAAAVLAPSRSLAGRLERVLGRPVTLLPYPFPDPPPFAPPPSRDLLFLGRGSPEKGLAEFLRALGTAEAGDPPLRLTAVGGGPETRRSRSVAGEAGIADRVEFRDWVPLEELPALVGAHGAVVVPSTWMENSPLVVHEALSAGRPVLGSTRGGIPELVEDGVEGFLFDPLDSPAAAAAVGRYAALTPEAHGAMARRARERAVAGGGTDRFLSALLEVYHSIIHRDTGERP